MRKVYPFIGLMFGAFLMSCLPGCKKDTTPGIGFSTSQVSLDAYLNPTATVTVTLSQPVNGVTDLWLQNVGPDTLQFGSYNAKFLNDDSFRIVGVLGPTASIDTPIVGNMVHVTLPEGATSFTLALTALADNFAKRAVEYRIKMISANNGTISSSKNMLTINIAATPMVPVFASTIPITDIIGGFDTVYSYNTNTQQFDTTYKPINVTVLSNYNLSKYTFTPNGQGTWDFTLSYAKKDGNDTATTFNLACLGITPALGPTTYPTSDGLGSVTTNFKLSPTPSSVRGNYYIMSDTLRVVKWSNGDNRQILNGTANGVSGYSSLSCTFIDF